LISTSGATRRRKAMFSCLVSGAPASGVQVDVVEGVVERGLWSLSWREVLISSQERKTFAFARLTTLAASWSAVFLSSPTMLMSAPCSRRRGWTVTSSSPAEPWRTVRPKQPRALGGEPAASRREVIAELCMPAAPNKACA